MKRAASVKSIMSEQHDKNNLVGNINKCKKSGTSRGKKNSTVSDKAYKDMKAGWPKKGRKGK